MAKFELLMPKLGESVQEATITQWFVKVGDKVEEDMPLLEVATDKVDSEIPSPVAGKVIDVLYKKDDVVAVNKVIALIAMEGEEVQDKNIEEDSEVKKQNKKKKQSTSSRKNNEDFNNSDRFYSPLVKNIANKENISFDELEQISGTGLNNRVTKKDLLKYIENRSVETPKQIYENKVEKTEEKQSQHQYKVNVSVNSGDEIFEMDRMRRMIADHMVTSKHVAPHVTSMIEADVTNIVIWRNKIKERFLEKEKEKITFLPVFIHAISKALKDYPGVNASVDGYKIIHRKNINIGIAVALDNGNLIVPVIKNSDHLNILGITKELNRLAKAARENKLKPDEIEGGTFSISNFGSFKNVMGTPIINQPQVAIMAIGTIEKKPAVVETPTGDIIAVRYKMFLSLTYDHRAVDGALGGAFLRKVADYIEAFDVNTDL